MKQILLLLLSTAFLSVPNTWAEETTAASKDPQAILPEKNKLPLNLLKLGQGKSFSRFAIIADKSTRTLSVWENVSGQPAFLEAHPMDIGKKTGDKLIENDNRTPEGIYFPQKILEGKELNYDNYGVKAYTLDYPNFFDRRQKKTGYGIWLHAIPETKSLNRGSRGCVVVRNEIVTELGQFIDLKKTPFIIDDKVEYVDLGEFEKQGQALDDWLKAWAQDWQSKSIDSYIQHYASDFKSLGMNKRQWKRYKQNLNKKYSSIQVNIYKPIFLNKDDMYIVSFLQEYESEALKDFGIKTLYIKKREGEYKILGEVWKKTPKSLHSPDDLEFSSDSLSE